MDPLFPDPPGPAASPAAPAAGSSRASLPPDSTPVFIRRRSRGNSALAWLLAAVVVILLAAAAGLVSAWVVASLRAVPPPAVADATATPSPSETATASPADATATATSTLQPRRTPTPSPEITPEAEPFVHVVQRGESLSYIASLYGVELDDIVELNDIANPNRIQVGQELLIPGYGVRPTSAPG